MDGWCREGAARCGLDIDARIDPNIDPDIDPDIDTTSQCTISVEMAMPGTPHTTSPCIGSVEMAMCGNGLAHRTGMYNHSQFTYRMTFGCKCLVDTNRRAPSRRRSSGAVAVVWVGMPVIVTLTTLARLAEGRSRPLRQQSRYDR
eukprot:365662-Chlamydomonas_euryale.AAC.9